MWNKKAASCVAIALVVASKREEKNKRRWMKERFKKINKYTHENLLNELRISEPSDFQNFLRLDSTVVEELLRMVIPEIQKRDTMMRNAIPPSQRLSITLRYLATGNTFEDLKFTSAVSPQSIGIIVMETCTAIINCLKDYIKLPATEAEWKAIVNGFNVHWKFPNCLGAVDGKHVSIKKPPPTGSYYYNYKKFFSIVMMAVVNYNYQFIMVDAGINGRISDGGILTYTEFGKALSDKSLQIPEPAPLPNSQKILHFVFVGDDAFALTENFMKPYSQTGLIVEKRIFNYRLSRLHRVVENAFGILVSRFGVFQRPIALSPEKVQITVLACCYMHNYLRRNQSQSYMCSNSVDVEDFGSGNIVEGTWRTTGQSISLLTTHARNSPTIAESVRDSYCDFFNNEGQVPWQDKFV